MQKRSHNAICLISGLVVSLLFSCLRYFFSEFLGNCCNFTRTWLKPFRLFMKYNACHQNNMIWHTFFKFFYSHNFSSTYHFAKAKFYSFTFWTFDPEKMISDRLRCIWILEKSSVSWLIFEITFTWIVEKATSYMWIT